jgi:hypothetical protein
MSSPYIPRCHAKHNRAWAIVDGVPRVAAQRETQGRIAHCISNAAAVIAAQDE